MNKDVYIMYSDATDKTGKELMKALDVDGGTAVPKGPLKLFIGWGAKVQADSKTNLNAACVYNHPDTIAENRNKFTTLEKMATMKGVNVAPFISYKEIPFDEKKMKAKGFTNIYPLVGRRNFHQGGKGFWLCLNEPMVNEAIKEGAQYFQQYINVLNEYRLHIFGGNLIYAQKKVARDDAETAFVEQHRDKIEGLAKKNNVDLDQKTLDYVLGRVAKENTQIDMVIRSNKRGWKFSRISESSIPKDLVDMAKAALKATNMSFGAVDCCIDVDKKPFILEINSGPGLQESSFEVYVDAFKKAIIEHTKPTITKKETKIETKEAASSSPTQTTKSKLMMKIELMKELAEQADDDEAKALDSLFKKLG